MGVGWGTAAQRLQDKVKVERQLSLLSVSTRQTGKLNSIKNAQTKPHKQKRTSGVLYHLFHLLLTMRSLSGLSHTFTERAHSGIPEWVDCSVFGCKVCVMCSGIECSCVAIAVYRKSMFSHLWAIDYSLGRSCCSVKGNSLSTTSWLCPTGGPGERRDGRECL